MVRGRRCPRRAIDPCRGHDAQLRMDRSGRRYLEAHGAAKLIGWGVPALRRAGTEPVVDLLDQFWSIATARVTVGTQRQYVQLAKFDSDWLVTNVLTDTSTAAVDVAAPDDAALCAPGNEYAQAWFTADGERMGRALHPELCKRDLRLTKSGAPYVEYLTYSELVCSDRAHAAAPPAGRGVDVRCLDTCGSTAVVRVAFLESLDGDRPLAVEHLLTADLDGAWRIVDVLWETTASSIQTRSTAPGITSGTGDIRRASAHSRTLSASRAHGKDRGALRRDRRPGRPPGDLPQRHAVLAPAAAVVGGASACPRAPHRLLRPRRLRRRASAAGTDDARCRA